VKDEVNQEESEQDENDMSLLLSSPTCNHCHQTVTNRPGVMGT